MAKKTAPALQSEYWPELAPRAVRTECRRKVSYETMSTCKSRVSYTWHALLTEAQRRA